MFYSNYQVLLQLILTRKQNEQIKCARETPRPKMLKLFGDGDASAQGTSEFAHERRNRLQRERRVKRCEQPSFHNDALQLFGDEDALAEGTSESAHERRNRL